MVSPIYNILNIKIKIKEQYITLFKVYSSIIFFILNSHLPYEIIYLAQKIINSFRF